MWILCSSTYLGGKHFKKTIITPPQMVKITVSIIQCRSLNELLYLLE